jgi:hypothetical protein
MVSSPPILSETIPKKDPAPTIPDWEKYERDIEMFIWNQGCPNYPQFSCPPVEVISFLKNCGSF